MGKIHNIVTYGARADGRTENTAQIQAAREYILARQRGRDQLFGGKRRDFLVVEGAGKGKCLTNGVQFKRSPRLFAVWLYGRKKRANQARAMPSTDRVTPVM